MTHTEVSGKNIENIHSKTMHCYCTAFCQYFSSGFLILVGG